MAGTPASLVMGPGWPGVVGQSGARSPVFNFRPGPTGNMAAFSIAKAAMGSGTRPLVIEAGDSQIMSYNVQGMGYSDAAANSFVRAVADRCIAGGLPVNKDIGFCHHGPASISAFTDYDRRFSFNGTDWAFGSDTTITGNALREASATTPMSFALAGICNKVTVWYNQRSSSTGFFSTSDGATALGTTSTIGTAAFRSVTFDLASRAAGKTINIARTTDNASPINIVGVIGWDSTIPAVDMIDAGRFGTKASAEWLSAGSPWSALNAIAALAPHLLVINLGANDIAGGVSAATYKTSMQTIISAGVSAGSSVLLVNHTKGTQPTYGTAQQQADYSTAVRELAVSNDIPLIDEGANFGPWASAQSLFSDAIHNNVAGVAKRAGLRAQVLLAA